MSACLLNWVLHKRFTRITWQLNLHGARSHLLYLLRANTHTYMCSYFPFVPTICHSNQLTQCFADFIQQYKMSLRCKILETKAQIYNVQKFSKSKPNVIVKCYIISHTAQRMHVLSYESCKTKNLLFDLPFIEIKMCTHGIICLNKFMLLKPRS